MVIVLNFGSQFAHLIARRVRELGVRAEILPFDTPLADLQTLHPAGIILSGSPASALDKKSLRPDAGIFGLKVPILGICYGHQLIAQLEGGKVTHSSQKEFGKETLLIRRGSGLFANMQSREIVWFSHGDQVSRLPKGFRAVASTPHCRFAAFEHTARKIYGIQFHPEVTHTPHGMTLLRNFVFGICEAKKNWRAGSLVPSIVESIRKEVGERHVVIGISGGVDSLVAATLIHRAIGNRLHAVFVDTGLLREGEVKEVATQLRTQGFKGLRVVSAASLFLRRLRGVSDPEKKRKIIGHAFIEVFERIIRMQLKRYPIAFLAQGTIYPDRIESASLSKTASKIKTHHNLALPEKLGFKILEPLRDLYKDEVRHVGLSLHLPKACVFRHPFPGPGLAIRMVGAVTTDRLRILRAADAIFIKELCAAGEYEKIWMAFAALLPVKTTGVMGDARTYECSIVLRAVDSVDTMSADWHKIPAPLLERISSIIVNNVRGVNRVFYDITQKPPATMEYE